MDVSSVVAAVCAMEVAGVVGTGENPMVRSHPPQRPPPKARAVGEHERPASLVGLKSGRRGADHRT
jgi:hypothetical protein